MSKERPEKIFGMEGDKRIPCEFYNTPVDWTVKVQRNHYTIYAPHPNCVLLDIIHYAIRQDPLTEAIEIFKRRINGSDVEELVREHYLCVGNSTPAQVEHVIGKAVKSFAKEFGPIKFCGNLEHFLSREELWEDSPPPV